MMGGGKLNLLAKVVPTPEELEVINKYKMHKEIIWQKNPADSVAPSFMGVKTMTVGTLINGESFTCKDIGQMLQMEEHITRTAQGLKVMVDAAKGFGGDTVIDL